MRKLQALLLRAIAEADRARDPEVFLTRAREATPWSKPLNSDDFDTFLAAFLRARRDERAAAAIVARWRAIGREVVIAVDDVVG